MTPGNAGDRKRRAFRALSQSASLHFIILRQEPGSMAKKTIETVCGYSCSDCDHHGNECRGCPETKGIPFWTTFIGIDRCAIYDCCTNDRKFPHCGKCPDLMCERFDRIKDNPEMNEAEAATCLAAMERELRSRK